LKQHTRKDRQRFNLTICGSFGFGNAGDEAVPLAISDLAEALEIDVVIRVLGRFPRPALSQVIGLASEDAERRAELKGHPIIVAGGGVLEPRESCVLFRCVPYLQKSFAPTLALYGANVESGRKYNWRLRFRVKKLLRQFDRLYVRDVLGADALRSLVPNKKVEVIGDSVLWMKPAPTVPSSIELVNPFIAVTFAKQWRNDANWYEWIAHQLSRLAVEQKAAILFVPLTAFDVDIQEQQKVATLIRRLNSAIDVICIEDQLEPRDISSILSRSMLTISMRLHGCVMAYAQKVPFVALAYHPKVLGFVKTVGWEKFCLPQTPPDYQSQGVYGYTFSDTKMAEIDLVKIALDAMEYSCFEKLEPLKKRLANAFLDIYSLYDDSN